MELNVELAKKVVEQVESYPEQFDMRHFGRSEGQCGTVCCLAGWVLILSGKYMLSCDDMFIGKKGKPVVSILIEAANLLGVPYADSDSLFEISDRERLIHIFMNLQSEKRALQLFKEFFGLCDKK